MSSIFHWTASGIRLAAEVEGPEGAPTVVMLHGGGQTRHAWAGASTRLAALGYRVIRCDTRGHGDSGWAADGDYSLEALADDLRALRATIDGPVALVGASLGGLTSFYALGTHEHEEELAQALVLVDVVLRPQREGVQRIKRFMSANPDGFASLEDVADAIAAYNPDRPRAKNLDGLLKNVRLGPDGRYRWHWDPTLLVGMDDPEDRTDQLFAISHRVTLPTLVLRGQRSDVVDQRGVEEMRELLPHLEVEEIGGAGHMIAGDRNDAFVNAIGGFLTRHFPVE
ncbi:MAG: alpha/beta hydrolase [Sphingobium sp.]